MPLPDAPIRLAFCITDLDPGGAERALVQLVTRLDRSRWEPHVVCLSGPGELVETLEDANIPVTCLGARRSMNMAVVFRLYRLLGRLKPALLQTYLYHANLAGRVAGRLAGVKTIVCGIRVAEQRSGFRLWLDRVTDRLVARHVCVSHDVADFSTTRGRLPAHKIVVIPNGVDVEKFASAASADLSEFGIPDGATTVMSVGRLDRQKGPFVLLEAFDEVLKTHGDVHLLFVGAGPLKEQLELWVADHRLAEHVHFSGQRGDVPSLLNAADIFVLPSRWEGMPNALLEAMAAGLPVIASRVEGTAELIENQVTGLSVSPDAPHELATALSLLLNDSEQSAALGGAAQRYVTKQFTWNVTVDAYDRLYRSLLDD